MNKAHLVCLLLAMVASTMAGCGRGLKLVKVSGKVMIDGKPLERGFVQVIPKDSRAASGEIGAGGKFTLTTFDNGDDCAVVVIDMYPVTDIFTHAVELQFLSR